MAPIGSDFTIDTLDKKIHHTANNNVYTVNDLYTHVMDTFDELTHMDDEIPMSAQTPTEYTMINGWFIDDDSVKYLKEGAIETVGYVSFEIHRILLTADPGTVAGDIGKPVKDDGTTVGPLLWYNNTEKIWYCRDTRGSQIKVDTGSTMTIDGGTGSGTADGDSVSGEELYANIYALGTLAENPDPQVYVFQDGESIVEWSDKANWAPGTMDVLIKIKNAGTTIDSGNVTVFCRQYGDSYDHYGITLTGGRNAIPFATAIDSNNTSGSHFLLYDTDGGTSFTAGLVLTGGTSGATAEIISNTDFGTNDGILELGNVKGTFQDPETITDTSTGSAATNGTLGDTYLEYTTTADFAVDEIVTGGTSTAKRKIKGIGDTKTKMVMIADVEYYDDTNNGPKYYVDFAAVEVLTGSVTGDGDSTSESVTIVSGFNDIGIWFVNGTITYGTQTQNFTKYEKVTQATSNATGFILHDDDQGATGTLTLGNVTGTWNNTNVFTGTTVPPGSATSTSTLTVLDTLNQAFDLGTDEPYNVVIACRGNTLANVYQRLKLVNGEDSTEKMYPTYLASATKYIEELDGEEYLIAYRDDDTPANSYAPVKASPLGTFAGGKYFGAPGIWIEGMHSDDIQNYQVIDAQGDTNNPPNKQVIKITNLISSDRISVFLDDASGQVDKIYSCCCC
jgi:hypothetical protein